MTDKQLGRLDCGAPVETCRHSTQRVIAARAGRTTVRALLSILALLLSLPSFVRSTAWAAGTLDQSYTASPNLFGDIDAAASFKQTYTAGITGTLNQVSVLLTDVSLTSDLPLLTVDIQNGKGVVIGSATIKPPPGLPNWNIAGSGGCAPVSVTISAPQVAGRTYAIALSSTTSQSLTYGWCGTASSGYAGGRVYEAMPPGSKWIRPKAAGDLDFSTYVGP